MERANFYDRSVLRRHRARSLSRLPRSIVAGIHHRKAFASIEGYCMFIGYPRSGHSLLGSLLNAHPNALIAHEQNALQDLRAGYGRRALFGRLYLRDAWFESTGRKWTGYDYSIGGGWQGRHERLHIIGDKQGGSSTRLLHDHPELLHRLRDTVGVPIHVLHHVRNPFDNITTIAIKGDVTLDHAIDLYFRLARTNKHLIETLLSPHEVIQTRHENLIQAPSRELGRILQALRLPAPEGYFEECAKSVFESPKRSRTGRPWSESQIERVNRQIASFAFLDGYGFDN